MFDAVIDIIMNWLLTVFRDSRVVVLLISVLPIVEARLAIPIGIEYGMNGLESWMWAYLGSSMIVPILLLILIPFIKWLSKTKLFKKVGQVIYEKFDKKAGSLSDSNAETKTDTDSGGENKLKVVDTRKRDFKKMLGVFIFVAIPMPLTGVWTGSAVASITKLGYVKSLIAILAGNLVASAIITLLSVFLSAYTDIIITVISLIAVAVVIALIVKIILHKPAEPISEANNDSDKE